MDHLLWVDTVLYIMITVLFSIEFLTLFKKYCKLNTDQFLWINTVLYIMITVLFSIEEFLTLFKKDDRIFKYNFHMEILAFNQNVPL